MGSRKSQSEEMDFWPKRRPGDEVWPHEKIAMENGRDPFWQILPRLACVSEKIPFP
jgi:hypothetical protein